MENLFFFSSKILWQLISPDNLFVILLVVALLLRYVGKRLYARRIFAFLIISVVFVSLFPLGGWLLYPLETRFQHNPKLPDRVDGIILLGGSIMPELSDHWQQLEINDYVDRSRRMHRNDLENIPAFLACGLLFVVTGPSFLLANILMYGFVGARLVHTLAYATAQSHEVRATLYTIVSVMVIVMAAYVLAVAFF